MPHWHKDYLELKAIKKQQMLEELCLPSLYLKAYISHEKSALHGPGRGKCSYHWKWGVNERWIYTNKTIKIILIFY